MFVRNKIKLIISCLNASFKNLIVWLQLHPKLIASDRQLSSLSFKVFTRHVSMKMVINENGTLTLDQNYIYCCQSPIFGRISPTESMDFLTVWLLVT